MTQPLQLTPQDKEAILNKYIAESSFDFYGFARGLKIEANSKPILFELVMADFQRETFQDIAPSLEQLRDGKKPDKQRWWIERTKKSSKDADLAIMVLWLIAFPRRPFLGQIGASSSRQASIVRDRIIHITQFNPWLLDYVEVMQYGIRSKKKMKDDKTAMAEMQIMSSSVNRAHGATPDFLIINELTHVDSWEFVQNLKSNADGVPNGLMVICTNAGYTGTEAETWKNNALTSPLWSTHILDRPAPWHNRPILEDARKMEGTESRYNRLWLGEWQSGKGDALTETTIRRCFRLMGPSYKPEDGWWYIGGLDLGIKHDHSAFAVLGVNPQQRAIKVPLWKSWKPGGLTRKVDLQAVRQYVREQAQAFHLQCVIYDPTEAELMSQDLETIVNMREMRFSIHSNCTLMAETLLQVMEAGQLVCYDDVDGTLRRDFGKLCVEERRYGFKITASSDEFGHADVATAIIMALPHCMQMMESFAGWNGQEELYNENKVILSEREIDSMPDELREIYNLGESMSLSRLLGNDYGIDQREEW